MPATSTGGGKPRMRVEVAAGTTASQTSSSASTTSSASTSSQPAVPKPQMTPRVEPHVQASPAPQTGGAAPAPTASVVHSSPQPVAEPSVRDASPSEPTRRDNGSDGSSNGAWGKGQDVPAPVSPPSAEQQKKAPSFSPSEWVHRTFAGHEHAFYGGVIAFVIALLVFAVGFWPVLFICLLVVAGVALGQVFDGDPRIIRAIRNLFPSDDGNE